MLWPALEPPDRQGHRNLPWTWSFTRHGLSDPLLFHALTSASAVAVQMFKGVTKARERLVLQHETQAVQLVRGELSENSGNPRDELLFAMILMMRSTDNVVALAEAKTLGAFRPPLTNLQNLQAGSSLSYRTTHREILCRLVAQKGGIAAIAIPGVAEFFNMYVRVTIPAKFVIADRYSMDLFQASLGSQRPDFDLCSSYGHFLDSEVPVLRQKYQAALSVASHFPTAELEESFQLIVCDIRCYLDMIESYGQVRWPHVHHGTLASFRNVIQHRLLSVDSNPSKPLREVCRLAILLFSSVVVYPLQNRKPMLFYLDNMTKLLKSEQHMDENFRLWLLVLGGMAADQAPLQSWYVSKLRSLVSTQPKSWSRVRELLRGFLWLDSACGEGGLELWLRVIQDD